MIDLHCHLLPGIDDGPDTPEQSLEMCRIAAADGITHAITTPHIHPGRWENTKPIIESKLEELKSALKKQDIPLQTGYAAEVRLTDQVIHQVEREEIPYLGEVDGYHIMLLEFPHGHIIPGSEKLVNWLLQRKIRPLIAHPERNKQVMRDHTLLEPFLAAGCWLQLTAGSITGNFGPAAMETAHELLRRDAVTVVATDAHNTGPRKPALKAAYDWITAEYGEQRACRLMLDTPALIASAQGDKLTGMRK